MPIMSGGLAAVPAESAASASSFNTLTQRVSQSLGLGILNAYLTSAQAGVDADAAHIGFVTDVIAQHGAEARYTVLVYHHSIYSPANHANDGDNKERRKDFPTAFSNLGVDLVLSLKTLKVQEPPKRKAGALVKTVEDLVAKLKNEARVIQ